MITYSLNQCLVQTKVPSSHDVLNKLRLLLHVVLGLGYLRVCASLGARWAYYFYIIEAQL